MRDSAGMQPAVLSRGDGLQGSASASSLPSRNSSEFRDTLHKSPPRSRAACTVHPGRYSHWMPSMGDSLSTLPSPPVRSQQKLWY